MMGTYRLLRWWYWCWLPAGLLVSGCTRFPVDGCLLEEAKQNLCRYHESGAYENAVKRALKPAFRRLEMPVTGERAAVVLDIDETALSTWEYQKGLRFGHYGPAWRDWTASASPPAIGPVHELYRICRERGVAVFFVTGRRENTRVSTEASLRQAGYTDWSGLMMKPDNYREPSVAPFKTRCRQTICDEGYRIILNIGDQQSDLEGGFAEKTVKLPNHIYVVP